jgi:hypothetical protein
LSLVTRRATARVFVLNGQPPPLQRRRMVEPAMAGCTAKRLTTV